MFHIGFLQQHTQWVLPMSIILVIFVSNAFYIGNIYTDWTRILQDLHLPCILRLLWYNFGRNHSWCQMFLHHVMYYWRGYFKSVHFSAALIYLCKSQGGVCAACTARPTDVSKKSFVNFFKIKQITLISNFPCIEGQKSYFTN